ncbi:hypothetical protein HMPREF1624_05968 [Sporothrix schenckii ATCC 58251]|uniref:Atos-like conserved domain-containing protein n=1 Tax=Sporothrix schenckii (strain ATCC 58251 / de Perez 2211183) TaxID=1391915 RepID=U7PQC5_SPOS1|nr:hypothetical protein HMPREF1624_05968 [Sporothrix schenckii ATCC 58251]
MFEDTMELAQSGELPPKEPSPPPRPSPPSESERVSTPSKPISIPTSPFVSRRMSEESIRTDLCEGPLPDTPSPLPRSFVLQPSPASDAQHGFADPSPPRTPPSRDASEQVTDRAELIERIKRGESPTWIPNRHIESMYHKRTPTQSPRPPSADIITSTTLLPAADITPERIPLEAHDHNAEAAARLEDGLNIERPRSALHSGDFTQSTSSRRQARTSEETEARPTGLPRPGPAADVSPSPWVATSPPRHYTPFSFDHRSPPASALAELGVFRSNVPSPSSSISSSFVYMPPTSPLVQSQSNYDEDDGGDSSLPMDHIDIALGSSPTQRAAGRNLRRENTLPYQAHQPRRSLSTTSNYNIDHFPPTFNSASTPQTPLLSRSRRPSFTLDSSPLQHASMVGSYEESILRGRMSTTPSKPLDFLAQIGVLGLGAKCKPGLRCPAHVTLPFSAVFYSYATTSYGRSKAEDGPSPYVGMVDLENGLPNSGAEQRSKRKAMMPSRRTASRTRPAQFKQGGTNGTTNAGESHNLARPVEGNPNGDEIVMEDMHVERLDLSDTEANKPTATASRSHKRRPHGPKVPPGGSYRIPEQGQLQIIIKNQNKTAVKLFLVPYDLTGMEAGTKTFIRQRSYSAGPIIDNLPATSDTSSDRPILRYLIHLHICCPSRGRYYLYKSIRVVFANRVPDGKEKLRNELTFPEPLYSPYKPIRVMHPPAGIAGGSGYHVGGNGPGAALAAEKAYRRRSSGLSFTANAVSQAFDAFGVQHPLVPAIPTQSALPKPAVSSRSWSNHGIVGQLPFDQTESNAIGGRPFVRFDQPLGSPSVAALGFGPANSLDQTTTGKSHNSKSMEESSSSSSTGTTTVTSPALPLYKKLSKGDIGYGGNAFVSGSPAACEGLLSQRLRSLEVEKNVAPEAADRETPDI